MTARVILLHGFTGSPRSWEPVHAELGPSREVAPLALVGHAPGLVEGPETTFNDELDRLAREIDKERSPVDLVGYSLGARVALGLCATRPEIVRRAVLVGVNPGVLDDTERRERARADERWARCLETDGLAAFVDQWAALPLFATQRALPATVLEAQEKGRLAHDVRGLARCLRITGLASMPSYWDALPALGSCLHFVAGELDEKFRSIGERASRAARAPLSIVRGAGHNVPLEEPRALARLIEEVLH